MANKFEVQVVALDRFTKTFRDLNNKASKAVRPLTDIQHQVGALAKEMHLDKAAKGLGKVSDAAVTLTRTLGLSLGPLESVLGIGAAGGIVGGLLAAGGAALGLGVRFAGVGFEVSRTAQKLGVTTAELQGYRGAARLAGLDADVATAAISSLGDTLQDAKWGRNPLALQMLNKFGLAVHTSRDGVIDTMATMRELSGVLQNVADPHVAAIIARAFGLEDALPLLRQGPEAIDKLTKSANDLGVVAGPEALKWSVDFTTSLNHMKVAIDGAANSLGASLVPSMSKGIDYLSARLKQSKEHPFRAAGGEIFDFMAAGPRLVGAGAQRLFGSSPGTTQAQRMVSGQIGGPLQQGAYKAPGAGAGIPGTVSAAAEGAGPVNWHYDPAVQAERDRAAMGLVQSELANATNMNDRAALTRELAARRAGAATNTLSPQAVKVEVAFKNAPPGTTATARSTSENAFVPTRVSYSMPSGDMP